VTTTIVNATVGGTVTVVEYVGNVISGFLHIY